jgi:histone H3/H4
MGDMLVVKSKVADYVRNKGMMCASDTSDALSNSVQKSLDSAIARCKENGRKTVKPYDL